jgi:hypothetical protein
MHGIGTVLGVFKGYIDGLDESNIVGALQVIQSEKIGQVYIDGSNLGAFPRHLKKKWPNISVTTFFHNVKARFFLGSLRQQKTLRSLAIFVVNYLAKRRAVSCSHKIICMSQRDSGLLQKIYGRAATHILPTALQDKMSTISYQCDKPQLGNIILTVGGIFYANRAGITWLVKNLVRH